MYRQGFLFVLNPISSSQSVVAFSFRSGNENEKFHFLITSPHTIKHIIF